MHGNPNAERCLPAMVLLILALWVPATAGAALPATPADEDHDGIPDALKQFLAERYAPVISIHPHEPNYPVNVEWFLREPTLSTTRIAPFIAVCSA